MARRRRIANLSAGEVRTDRGAILGELFDLSAPARSRNRRTRNCVVRDLVTILEQAVRHCVASRVDACKALGPAELTIRMDDVAYVSGLTPGTLTSLALTVSSAGGMRALCKEFGLPDLLAADPGLEEDVQALLSSRHLRTHRMIDVTAGTAGWHGAVETIVLGLFAALPYGDIDFYLARADYMHENRRPDEAAKSYARAESLCAQAAAAGRPGAEAHTRRGLALAGMGRAEEAVGSYDEAIAADPGRALAHLNRGIVLAGMGRAEEAVGSYDEAIRLDPALARAHLSKANALAALGRTGEALDAYDSAIRLGGAAADAHTDKGALYAGQGCASEALDAYDAAIDADPYAARAYFKKGQLLHHMGRNREAAECYNAAIEIDVGAADAYAGRAEIDYSTGRLDEALASYNEAIAINSKFANAHAGRGNVLAAMGRARDALGSYEQALRIDPAHANAQAGRSRALEQLGGNNGQDAAPRRIES